MTTSSSEPTYALRASTLVVATWIASSLVASSAVAQWEAVDAWRAPHWQPPPVARDERPVYAPWRTPPPPPPVDVEVTPGDSTDERLERVLAERRGTFRFGVDVGMFGYDTGSAFASTDADGVGWNVALELARGMTARLDVVASLSLGDQGTTVQSAFTGMAGDCYDTGSTQRTALAIGLRVRPWLRSTFHVGAFVHAGAARATIAVAARCNVSSWAPLVGLSADTAFAFGPSNHVSMGVRWIVDRASPEDEARIPVFGGTPESGMPAVIGFLLYVGLSVPSV